MPGIDIYTAAAGSRVRGIHRVAVRSKRSARSPDRQSATGRCIGSRMIAAAHAQAGLIARPLPVGVTEPNAGRVTACRSRCRNRVRARGGVAPAAGPPGESSRQPPCHRARGERLIEPVRLRGVGDIGQLRARRITVAGVHGLRDWRRRRTAVRPAGSPRRPAALVVQRPARPRDLAATAATARQGTIQRDSAAAAEITPRK